MINIATSFILQYMQDQNDRQKEKDQLRKRDNVALR